MSSQRSVMPPLAAIAFPISNQQLLIRNDYSSYFLNSSDAFVPPKPNEFDSA